MNPKSTRRSDAVRQNIAARLLSRMRLWQKFLLLGIVTTAMMSYPMYTSVKADLDAIDNVHTEQSGLPGISAVEALVQGLQDHRTTSSYLALNDSARAAPRGKAIADIDEALGRLDKLAPATGDSTLQRRLSDVKQDWQTLRAAVDARKLDERQVLVQHTALIQKSIDMIADWTAYSLIDLDPDAVTYYSFRAALADLPQLKEALRALRSPVTDRLEEIGRARSLTGQAMAEAMRDAFRPDDRARFLDWIKNAEASSKNYSEDIRKAVLASPALKGDLTDQASQLVAQTEQATQFLRREIISKDIPTVDPATLLRELNGPRSLSIKGSELALKQLESSLAARETKAKHDMTLVLSATAVLVLVGVAIALLTVRNITGTVSRLQESVDKVREGDFEALQAIESHDEVGDLGRTVNDLLQERIAAQRKAEAENEALNNSVISILQAVNQLSQRDLTAKAPVTQDVIGTVSDSINLLTDETAKVLHGVTHIAGQVELVSGKVKSQADLVSKTAEDERESVKLMINSLADATQTMNQVAALAEQSNTSAEQATQATVTALDTVNGTVRGMESIRETIAEAEKRIKRLGERSQEISGIVNLINTISERTHVLALNASMQAAVAGDAGRGFAVVAEEVQRLAESSRNATQQISSLVNNIQLETNETINTVNHTIGQVVQGSEQAQKAGEQMRRTQEITAQLVSLVRRIAETSDVQKEMSVHLLESVQHIGESTQRTAEQIGAQNQETETLLLSARRLVESVNVFKLPQAA